MDAEVRFGKRDECFQEMPQCLLIGAGVGVGFGQRGIHRVKPAALRHLVVVAKGGAQRRTRAGIEPVAAKHVGNAVRGHQGSQWGQSILAAGAGNQR